MHLYIKPYDYEKVSDAPEHKDPKNSWHQL